MELDRGGALDRLDGDSFRLTREVAERNADEEELALKDSLVDASPSAPDPMAADEPRLPEESAFDAKGVEPGPPLRLPPPALLARDPLPPEDLLPPEFRPRSPREPRSRGVRRDTEFSAPVVPVSRIVDSRVPVATVAVRIAAGAAVP
ncbi:MAG: hypothetical protein ACRD7E_12260 [Bryobacteraceae bacterium]